MAAIKGIVSLAFFALCANASGVLGAPQASSDDVCWKRTTVRGAGVVPSECPDGEKSEGLCYPRCPAGYTGVGPVCWQSCPEGYHDAGSYCWREADIIVKNAQTRGMGWPMSCRAGYVSDAGLCYPPCDRRSIGVGPVCWVRCSGDMPVECGAGCARSQEACAQAISDQVLTSAELAVAVALESWGTAIAKGIEAANSFNLPICGGR